MFELCNNAFVVSIWSIASWVIISAPIIVIHKLSLCRWRFETGKRIRCVRVQSSSSHQNSHLFYLFLSPHHHQHLINISIIRHQQISLRYYFHQNYQLLYVLSITTVQTVLYYQPFLYSSVQLKFSFFAELFLSVKPLAVQYRCYCNYCIQKMSRFFLAMSVPFVHFLFSMNCGIDQTVYWFVNLYCE